MAAESETRGARGVIVEEGECVVGCDTVRLGGTGLGAEPLVESFDVGKLDPFGVVWKAFIVEHVSECDSEPSYYLVCDERHEPDFIDVRRPSFAGKSRGDVVQGKRGGHLRWSLWLEGSTYITRGAHIMLTSD